MGWLFDVVCGSGTSLIVKVAEGASVADRPVIKGSGMSAAQQQDLVSPMTSQMPVAFEVEAAESAKEAGSRYEDSPQFRGGATILHDSDYQCTAGFPVFHGAAPNRQYGMVTAAHCKQTYFYTPSGWFMGRTHIFKDDTIKDVNGYRTDVQMIRRGDPSSQPYGNAIFKGGWNSTTSHHIRNGGNPTPGQQRGFALNVSSLLFRLGPPTIGLVTTSSGTSGGTAELLAIAVLGHEQSGIPPEAVDLLDVAVEIPMVGTGQSLNVAVAGSLVLYRLAGLI